MVSDLLVPLAGEDSLRWAILLATVAYFWAGAHFLLAARKLREELASATETH